MYGSHADPSLLQLDALADCSRKLSVFVIRQLTLFFLNFSQSYELGNKSETPTAIAIGLAGVAAVAYGYSGCRCLW